MGGCSRTGLDDALVGTNVADGAATADGRAPADASSDVTTDSASPLDGAGSLDGARSPDASLDGGVGNGPPPDPSSASSYLIDTAHTGSIEDPTLAPPLSRAWTVGFGAPLSFPLIAQGRVYVVSGPGTTASSTLTALDAKTGEKLWAVPAGQAYSLALDNGRIFTLDSSTNLLAFDAVTGQALWKALLIQPPYGGAASAPPTAYRGVVYAAVTNIVMAVNEQDGSVLWSHTIWGGDISAPAVSDDGAFASFFCVQTYAYDRITGTPIWHDNGPCEAGEGATPVLFGGSLFTRAVSPQEDRRIDVTDGAQHPSFPAILAPAFHASRAYYVSGAYSPDGPTGTLHAINLPSGTEAWRFAGDGTLSASPVVVGGQVVVGSFDGNVYGVDEDAGTLWWSDDAGARLVSESTLTIQSSVVAMGAAGGILVVPAGSNLIGYAHADGALDGSIGE